ncbi:MAG: hypothetical protein HY982_01530 [Candidatus Magasanikbacteria bacterium]|nr:hypothetical protein [Candidatus Magasanikbacteria bacterium]
MNQRFFEILPAFLSWTTIILIFLLSWLLPVYVSVFIILFDIYWLLKTIYLSFHLRATFSKMKRSLKINWLRELTNLHKLPTNNTNKDIREISSQIRDYSRIYHLIILPMFKEPYGVVRESFEALAKTNYPKDKFIVVLATEEKGGENDAATAQKIEQEFGKKFFQFLITTHPANLPGEIPGKGSNETWAIKEVKRLIIDPLCSAYLSIGTGGSSAPAADDRLRSPQPDLDSLRGRGPSSDWVRELPYDKRAEQSPQSTQFNQPYFSAVRNVSEPERAWSPTAEGASEERGRESSGVPTRWGGTTAVPSGGKVGLSYENILVSVFDVDTQILPDYFSRLTYVFLTCPHPQRSSFQPIPFFTNNIFQAPALGRVISFSATFWHMMQQSRPERLTTFSSHSMPFKPLTEIGFWNKNVVSEDSRIFWQLYLHYNADWRVEPLFYPVTMDANVAPSFWQTMINLYKQQRRWAWGSENIPYMFSGFRQNASRRKVGIPTEASGKIPFRKKLYWGFNILEAFHSWATNALMIFALGWLPLFLGGPAFNATLLSYNLPSITRWIMTLAMVGIVSSAILSIILLPPKPRWFKPWHYLLYFLQWILMPLTLIIFGALPALEAQTRLALGGKYRLGFWVTPKSR